MKIIETNNQIEVKSGGLVQLIIGILIGIAGVALTIFILTGPVDDNGNKMPVWASLIGVVFAVGGFISIFFAKNSQTNIEKGGNVTITAKRLLGGKTENQSFPASNIVSVRLSTYADNTPNSNMQRRSVLQLVLNNNDVIDLGGAGSNGFSFNGMNVGSLISRAPLSKEANQIANFLGVPLDANDSSSIAGAVKSVTSAFQSTKPSNPQQPVEFNQQSQNASPQPQEPTIPPTPPQPPQPAPPVPPQEPPVVKPPENNQLNQ